MLPTSTNLTHQSQQPWLLEETKDAADAAHQQQQYEDLRSNQSMEGAEGGEDEMTEPKGEQDHLAD